MAHIAPRAGHESDAGALLVVGWALLAVTLVVVALRYYVRVTIVKRVAIDDYLMGCSVGCEVFHMGFITIATQHGLGQHFYDLTMVQQQSALKWTIGFVEIFAVITCMFGRMSFCAFLLFIIAPSDKVKRLALWSVIAAQALINLVVVIQIYSQCGSKVTALWDFEVAATATCQSPMVEMVLGYVQSSINSACDVVLSILPMTILWKLQMPIRQKVGLGLMLTLSVFALAASIGKCLAIANLGKGDLTFEHTLGYMVQLQTWVVVENNTVCLAASIPTLRSLLRKKGAAGSSTPAYHLSESTNRRVMSRNQYGDYSRHTLKGGSVVGHDNNSEEYILSSMQGNGDQITKTTDVTVTSEQRGMEETTERPETHQPLPDFLRHSQGR